MKVEKKYPGRLWVQCMLPRYQVIGGFCPECEKGTEKWPQILGFAHEFTTDMSNGNTKIVETKVRLEMNNAV